MIFRRAEMSGGRARGARNPWEARNPEGSSSRTTFRLPCCASSMTFVASCNLNHFTWLHCWNKILKAVIRTVYLVSTVTKKALTVITVSMIGPSFSLNSFKLMLYYLHGYPFNSLDLVLIIVFNYKMPQRFNAWLQLWSNPTIPTV